MDATTPRERLRVHNRPVGTRESKATLRKTFKSLKTRLDQKHGVIPGWEYAVIVRCLHERSDGCQREEYFVAGSPGFEEWVNEHAMECLASAHRSHADDGGDSSYAHALKELENECVKPTNAEVRAQRLRKLLARVWALHVAGTAHAHTKQMYNVVKKHPDMAFGWWNDVTGNAPFTNKAIGDLVVSDKVWDKVADILRDDLERRYRQHQHDVDMDEGDNSDHVPARPYGTLFPGVTPATQCNKALQTGERCMRQGKHKGRHVFEFPAVDADPLALVTAAVNAETPVLEDGEIPRRLEIVDPYTTRPGRKPVLNTKRRSITPRRRADDDTSDDGLFVGSPASARTPGSAMDPLSRLARQMRQERSQAKKVANEQDQVFYGEARRLQHVNMHDVQTVHHDALYN